VVREIRTFHVIDEAKERIQDIVRRGDRARAARVFLGTSVPTLYQNVALLFVLAGLGGVYLMGVKNFASLAAIVLLLIRALSYRQALQAYYHRFSDIGPYAETISARLAEFEAARVVDHGRGLA